MKRVTIAMAVIGLLGLASSARALELDGKGGIGGGMGLMSFLSGDDFSGNNNLRFIGQGYFKYNVTEKLTAVIETGFGWNSYTSDTEGVDDTLAVVFPTTLGAFYRFDWGESRFKPHVGAGLGLYSLGIKDTFRSWAEDVDGKRLSWTSPGAYLRCGGEYLFDNGAAINVELLYHTIFSEDADRFVGAGWGDQNTSFGQLRVGGNYYFSLGGSKALPEDEGDEQ